MNPQQILVEFYLALEKATGHGNIEKARAAARAIGCKFTNSESSAWLKPFIDAASKRQDERQPFGRADGRGIPSSTAGDLGSINGLTRGNCIPVKLPTVPNSQVEPNGSTHKPKRAPLLPLEAEERKARDTIIAAIEPELRPALRGMTWTAWRQRNGRTCMDMAKAGVTPQQAYEAWRDLSEERGEKIYTMRWVQERISRGNGAAPKPRYDPKNGCDCTLPVADCLRLHVDDGGPEWIVDIIAKQRAAGVYSGSIRTPLAASAP